jgi:hypothetical protein
VWRCARAETIIAAEIEPSPNRANQAALALQRLGLRFRHIGPTISVEGPQSLWTSTFNVRFEPRRKTVIAVEGGAVPCQKALTEAMRIPTELQALIAGVIFVEPPEFY